jgi:hypothetical protein
VVNYYEESTSMWALFLNYDWAFTWRERGISRNPHSKKYELLKFVATYVQVLQAGFSFQILPLYFGSVSHFPTYTSRPPNLLELYNPDNI